MSTLCNYIVLKNLSLFDVEKLTEDLKKLSVMKFDDLPDEDTWAQIQSEV